MKKISLLLFCTFVVTGVMNGQDLDKWPPFDTTSYGSNPEVGKYMEVRGIQMYYETYGSGEPLLLIYGNGSEISHFMCQIPFLSKHYKVIVADSRSHGRSVDNGDSLSFEMMTEDYFELLNKLEIDSCHIVGWSDGGNIGLMLAIHHPEKVKKLAITGANLRADSTVFDPFLSKGGDAYRKGLAEQEQTAEVRHKIKLYDLMANQNPIEIADLNKISIPVLVIAGDHDVIQTSHTVQIASSIPNSYLWILPNSGHATLIFYKDSFNQTVHEFLKKPFRKIDGWKRFE